MKLTGFRLRDWSRWMILVLLHFAVMAAHAATSPLIFTLDEPSKTSAAVYNSDGTLIRTLWGNVRFPAGTNTATWDGKDDNSNAVPKANYQIKLLQHNVEYIWDGAIGNTSAEMIGASVHRGFYFMQDMAISGTNAFYVSGYNEGQYDFRSFSTTDPQHLKSSWGWTYDQFGKIGSYPANIYDRSWQFVAADASWVYFACPTTFTPINPVNNTYAGCIVACNISDNSIAYFTNGYLISNGGNVGSSPYPNGIYVGTQPGLSGLSVQANGTYLAASVGPDDRVYLMNKRTGAAVTDFAVPSPGRINFSPNGSLWVVSGTSVLCYGGLPAKPTLISQIVNLSEPLDVAVNPSNPDIVLVADGGTNQQVKAFDKTGKLLWNLGQQGGYQKNGAAVTNDKFWFSYEGVDQTFLCFASDGSFWVGDEENHRTLHFAADQSYIDQIMYQPHSYIASVDQNNTNRVFNQFLEFNVDYSLPLAQSWTLVNNWKVGVDTNHITWNEGLNEVTTFPNGRTYALIGNNKYYNATMNQQKELCELGTNGLRFTGIFPMTNSASRWNSFGPDGSARAATVGRSRWYMATLKGFDKNGNPTWNPEALFASASEGKTDPVPRGNSFGIIRSTISSSNILISFDQSESNSWHLGGIKVGGTNWLWKASPSADLNGCGNYEVGHGLQYGGNTVQALDRNVLYGFHGEFFRGQGQAGQHLHYYDDGLFVGEFGEANNYHSINEGVLPAVSGNAHCFNLIKTPEGGYYLWSNDESAHGPQRWHLANAENIREQTGSGTLGNTITLSSPPSPFPTAVTAKSGNQSADISWQPVPGADSYNISYSLLNGGPYSILAGNTAKTEYIASGLSNGVTCYFVVTAIVSGEEQPASEQVRVLPFDTTQTVLAVGVQNEGAQLDLIVDVSSSAVAKGQAGYVGAEYLTGNLNLQDRDFYGYGQLMNPNVGTRGYAIFDFGGKGSHLLNIPSTMSVTTGAGWTDTGYLKRYYRVDGNMGAAYDTNGVQNAVVNGLLAKPHGSINITVSDDNYHFLTVLSPAYFSSARKYTLGITSTNSTTAQYTVNENPGFSHVFQFLFRGNITLWADATGGTWATIQSVFLDDASVRYPINLSPPTNFHVIKN